MPLRPCLCITHKKNVRRQGWRSQGCDKSAGTARHHEEMRRLPLPLPHAAPASREGLTSRLACRLPHACNLSLAHIARRSSPPQPKSLVQPLAPSPPLPHMPLHSRALSGMVDGRQARRTAAGVREGNVRCRQGRRRHLRSALNCLARWQRLSISGVRSILSSLQMALTLPRRASSTSL